MNTVMPEQRNCACVHWGATQCQHERNYVVAEDTEDNEDLWRFDACDCACHAKILARMDGEDDEEGESK